MAEKIFAKGINFRAPRDKAPSWIKGSISFKVADAIAFLQQHENVAGFVNVDVKESKDGGTLYCELNTYKPERPAGLGGASTDKEDRAYDKKFDEQAAQESGTIDYPAEDINPDDIPF